MSTPPLRIGLDLDNTLVCYDGVFARLASERGIACPTGGSLKRALRDALRRQPGGELEWTQLQGEAYGPGILESEPFPGARAAMVGWKQAGHEVIVVSHKTRFPALGAAHDFHAFARQWIARWFGDLGLPVFLELTRWTKLRRIESERCNVFVDDLLDFLEEPTFPATTRRVWFSPAPAAGVQIPATITRAASWIEIDHTVRSSLTPVSASPTSTDRRIGTFTGNPGELFAALVARHLDARLAHWEPLPGGINNVGAALHLADGRTVVGKIYKRSAADPRDRLQHETQFLRLLEHAGVAQVPRVLAIDEDLGAALHTLVPGNRWPENEPAPAEFWPQFDRFLADLQRAATLPEAAQLPLAAEAALTLQEHLAWVQERRDRWLGRALAGELPESATRLVLDELEPAYDHLARLAIAHPDFQRRIGRDQLILSPSDFGLHNALVDAEGRLSFVDFEYAGWDDPAKTDADFALQPRYAAGRPDRLKCLETQLERASPRAQLVHELLALKWRYIKIGYELSVAERAPAPALASAVVTTFPVSPAEPSRRPSPEPSPNSTECTLWPTK